MTHNIIDVINAIPYPEKTSDERADLLRLAKIGDRGAAFTLLRIYMGPMVKEAERSGRKAAALGYSADDTREEAFAEAVSVFYKVIDSFDADRGMRGFVAYLTRAIRNDEATSMRNQVARVPVMTLSRRRAVIKAADGDLELARKIAPDYGISRETFDAVSRVMDGAVQVGGPEEMGDDNPSPITLPYEDRGYVRVEHLQDAARALDSLDFTARMIVESAFGLNGQAVQSAAEIGESLGLTRWAVQRRLDAAMLVMRTALEDKENS